MAAVAREIEHLHRALKALFSAVLDANDYRITAPALEKAAREVAELQKKIGLADDVGLTSPETKALLAELDALFADHAPEEDYKNWHDRMCCRLRRSLALLN